MNSVTGYIPTTVREVGRGLAISMLVTSNASNKIMHSPAIVFLITSRQVCRDSIARFFKYDTFEISVSCFYEIFRNFVVLERCNLMSTVWSVPTELTP
jgi:hypothetical protein